MLSYFWLINYLLQIVVFLSQFFIDCSSCIFDRIWNSIRGHLPPIKTNLKCKFVEFWCGEICLANEARTVYNVSDHVLFIRETGKSSSFNSFPCTIMEYIWKEMQGLTHNKSKKTHDHFYWSFLLAIACNEYNVPVYRLKVVISMLNWEGLKCMSTI